MMRTTTLIAILCIIGAALAIAFVSKMRDTATDLAITAPQSLGYTYVSTSTDGWPPSLTESPGDESCAGRRASIAEHAFCVTESDEGAAGSTYRSYRYATISAGTTSSITFTVRFPQCMNYDEPQQSACTSEEKGFSADALVASMLSSHEER